MTFRGRCDRGWSLFVHLHRYVNGLCGLSLVPLQTSHKTSDFTTNFTDLVRTRPRGIASGFTEMLTFILSGLLGWVHMTWSLSMYMPGVLDSWNHTSVASEDKTGLVTLWFRCVCLAGIERVLHLLVFHQGAPIALVRVFVLHDSHFFYGTIHCKSAPDRLLQKSKIAKMSLQKL